MDHGLDATTALLAYRPYFALYDCWTLHRILLHRTNDKKLLIAWDFMRIFLAWATDQWCWRTDTHGFREESLLLWGIAIRALKSTALDTSHSNLSVVKLAHAFIACTFNLAVLNIPASKSTIPRRAITHLSSLLQVHRLNMPLISAAHLPDQVLGDIQHFKRALADIMSQCWPPETSATAQDQDSDNARFIALQVAALDLEFVKACVQWDKHVCPWVWHWFTQPELDRLMVNMAAVCETFSHMLSMDREETEVVGELVWMIGHVPGRMREDPQFWRTVRMLVDKYPSLELALSEV